MLRVENASITFNRNTVNERKALDNISIHLEKGDFVTVIGSNGAGKSTLLNAVCGTYDLDKGQILIDGIDVTRQREYKRAKHIGRLFQDPLRGTAPSMTIEENIGLAYSRGKKHFFSLGVSTADERLFREKLSELGLGLEDRLKTPVGLLSGGQRQALTLLMATIVTPSLLLLDEHTAALDPNTAEKVMEITDKIIKEHKITTLMITHNIKNALEYGNKTAVLSQGKLILELHENERKDMSIEKLMKLYASSTTDTLTDKMIL
jgi:putative ABC transport system ATP-binding protein